MAYFYYRLETVVKDTSNPWAPDFSGKKTGSQTGVNISVNLQAKGRDDCHTVMLVIRSLSFSSEVCEDG